MTAAFSSTPRPRLARTAELVQFGGALLLLASGWFSIAVSQIALGLSLLALLVRWAAGRAPARTGLEWPAAALALWALVMIPLSSDPGLSAAYYKRFFLFTAVWVTASVADTERRRFALLIALAVGAVGTSLYWQFSPLVQGRGLFAVRLSGIFNAMTTGALLMLGAAVAGGFLILPRLALRWRLVAVAALATLALGVMQTFTRSALLGLAVGGALICLVRRPRLFGALLAVLLLVGVVFRGPLLDSLPDRLEKRVRPGRIAESASPSIRTEMWRGGWQMIRAHPLTGVGDVGLLELAPRYYGDEDTKYYGHMHSNPVHLAVIWGVPGLLLGSWFLLAPGWILWRRWRTMPRDGSGPPAAAGWVLGALAAWAAFNIAGLTEWYFGDAESMLIYLGLLGCALGAANPPPVPNEETDVQAT
jgi:O-antigen ligase